MYARVAKWENGDADAVRKSAARMKEQAASGPPEGVPSNGFTLLVDPDNGQAYAIALFETEEDYRKGDETLDSMTPPDDGMGSRTSVEKYEVAIDLRL